MVDPIDILKKQLFGRHRAAKSPVAWTWTDGPQWNTTVFLVGGNSNIFYFHPFHPVTLGRWFNLTYSIFSKRVGEKPPTLKNGPKKRFLERQVKCPIFFGQQLSP